MTGLWFASDQSLSYLDGSLPGDYGFDPLGVCDPEGKGFAVTPSWLQYAEVIHARWAMLGAAGCVAPEILGKIGVIPAETAIPWFESGVIPPVGSYNRYWSDPYTIFFVEVVLMQFAELKRCKITDNQVLRVNSIFWVSKAYSVVQGILHIRVGLFFNMLG